MISEMSPHRMLQGKRSNALPSCPGASLGFPVARSWEHGLIARPECSATHYMGLQQAPVLLPQSAWDMQHLVQATGISWAAPCSHQDFPHASPNNHSALICFHLNFCTISCCPAQAVGTL